MAKKQPLLFELMKEEDPSQELQQGVDAGAGKAEISDSLETAETANRLAGSKVNDSPVKRNLHLRLNAYSLILAITGALIIFVCGFVLGKSLGYRKGIQERSVTQLADVLASPTAPDVLNIFSSKVQSPDSTKKVANQPEISINVEKTAEIEDIFQKDAKITRKSGLNYLIIQNFGLDAKPIAELARKFLAKQGVVSSVERSGRSYKLVSAIGFASNNDPKAQAFQRQIETLGLEFKKRRDAYGVSFQGCYYQKWK